MGAITGTGAGVLHTKFLVVDEEAFYVGSANMDWKSLALVGVISILFRQYLKLISFHPLDRKISFTLIVHVDIHIFFSFVHVLCLSHVGERTRSCHF